MKLLALSLITIYAPLLCYAQIQVVMLPDCPVDEAAFIREAVQGASELTNTANDLIQEYPHGEAVQTFTGLRGTDPAQLSGIHLRNIATTLKSSGVIPNVNSYQKDTIHISCSPPAQHPVASSPDAVFIDLPTIRNAQILKIGHNFFPGGSAIDTNVVPPARRYPFLTLQEDVSRYTNAFHAVQEYPFVSFPMSTNAVMRIVEVFQTTPLLMGMHTLFRPSQRLAPKDLVRLPNRAFSPQTWSILTFLAYAHRTRFSGTSPGPSPIHVQQFGPFGISKSGLTLKFTRPFFAPPSPPRGALVQLAFTSNSRFRPLGIAAQRKKDREALKQASSSSKPPPPHLRRGIQKSRVEPSHFVH